MLFNKIESLRIERKISQEKLAESIGRSREWYGAKKRSNNIMTNDLIAIANVLECPVSYFFEETDLLPDVVNEPITPYEKTGLSNKHKTDTLKNLYRIIESQEKTIKSQEKTIALQESRIEFLENKLSAYE